jgi:DNA-binding NarL/FixJ family response regulator
MIRILIADDHQMFIDGIKSLLALQQDIAILGEANNGNELLHLMENESPDLVLMDVNMPQLNGEETTRILRKQFPHVRVIMLTMHNSKEHIARMISAGAAGYILKNTGKDELLEAIYAVYRGETFYSKEVTGVIMESFKPKRERTLFTEAELTPREKEVLKLIAEELTSSEIAGKLFISLNTVETHRKNLMSKLNVKNTAGLVKYALQNGLAG